MQAASLSTESWIDELVGYCSDSHCEFCRDEPLREHTSLGVGGPADAFIRPHTIRQLTEIRQLCAAKSVPFFLIGNGTNLVVNDRGFRGVVLALNRLSSETDALGNQDVVPAGMPLQTLVESSIINSLSGLEALAGIPGSVGGAIFMNAGAYGCSIWQVMDRVWLLCDAGRVRSDPASDFPASYRSSGIVAGEQILGATFRLRPGDADQIRENAAAYGQRRAKTQPLSEKSAGCVFKNSPSASAGSLIDGCGLKGRAIGGAKVSERHANFIINVRDARAVDVLSLIDLLRNEVLRNMGVALSLEVEILGEFGLLEF